jgi:hypothetical protein
VVYSVGINDDTSFDREFVRRWPHCEVFAFDPSVGRETGDAWMGEGVSFFNLGLGDEDGRMGDGSGWELRTLGSLMLMLGHEHVDVLKMDIEGGEW